MRIATTCIGPTSKYVTEYSSSAFVALRVEGQGKVCRQRYVTDELSCTQYVFSITSTPPLINQAQGATNPDLLRGTGQPVSTRHKT